MHQEGPDLCRAYIFRVAPVMKEDKAFDPADPGFFRTDTYMLELQDWKLTRGAVVPEGSLLRGSHYV
jgi:hypothetical protein